MSEIKFVKTRGAEKDDRGLVVRPASWEAMLFGDRIGRWEVDEDGRAFGEIFGQPSDLIDRVTRWKTMVKREVDRREACDFTFASDHIGDLWESRPCESGDGWSEWHGVRLRERVTLFHFVGVVSSSLSLQEAFELRTEQGYQHRRTCEYYTRYGAREF